MNGLKRISGCRSLAMIATLFGAMVTAFLVPAYGQQEVDPSWYNPWTPPNVAVAQSAQPRVIHHRHVRTVKTASAQNAANLRGKRSTVRKTS
jgi:hypothetical protein